MIPRLILIPALLVALTPLASAAAATPAAEVLNQFAAILDEVSGYQLRMTKQQRIKGRLQPVETILLKQRRDPRCIYMRWIAGPHRGRELIHCADRDEGKIKVHAGGAKNIVTLKLDPEGSMAMRDNLHPVTSAGIFTIGRFAVGALDGELVRRQVGGRAADCFVSTALLDLGAYVAGRQELCLDASSRLPVQLKLWNAQAQIMEHYTYREYRTNLPLTDRDFDVRNSKYDFW